MTEMGVKDVKAKAMKVGAYEKRYTSGSASSKRKMFQLLVFYFKKRRGYYMNGFIQTQQHLL